MDNFENMLIYSFINIAIALLLDALLGDPPNWPHPIRFIGWMIAKIEKIVRRYVKNLYLGGFILMIGTLTSVALPIFLMKAIIHPTFFRFIEIYLLYTCVAARCLSIEGIKVRQSLQAGKIEVARKQLSYLVGRDTEQLEENEITRGVIETIAENTIDGVLAPLFYMIIGGIFGYASLFAMFYKSINTLDSMVGYVQEPYKEIGFFSAKTDDVFNWIPARIGSYIILISGFLCGNDFVRGFNVYHRDKYHHKSPNSGHPESAVAGLLGIQLGGTNSYFGSIVVKPTIGDSIHVMNAKHITQTIRIMFVSEVVLFCISMSILFLAFSF